jgi:xylulokinase
MVFGAPVVVPRPGEYVALGAARQAAWALAGGDQPPRWDADLLSTEAREGGDVAAGEGIRAAYAAARSAVYAR